MGQYYKGVCLGKNNSIRRVFEFGGKFGTIGEESPLINNIYNFLVKHPSRFVWIGDYAEPIKLTGAQKKMVYQYAEETAKTELHTHCSNEEYIRRWKHMADNGNINLYDWATIYSHFVDGASRVMKNEESAMYNYRYLVNLDKNEYVDLWEELDSPWNIKAVLSFLCADGGDREEDGNFDGSYYNGLNKKLIGRWAYDTITLISVNGGVEGLTRISGNFTDGNDIDTVLSYVCDWFDEATKNCLTQNPYVLKQIERLKKIASEYGK